MKASKGDAVTYRGKGGYVFMGHTPKRTVIGSPYIANLYNLHYVKDEHVRLACGCRITRGRVTDDD